MAKTKSTDAEAKYKNWTTIAATVISALSLSLNAILGFTNLKLNKERETLELQIRQRQVSPDLTTRYYVVSGLGVIDIGRADPGEPGSAPMVMENQVWRDAEEWLDAVKSGDAEVIETELDGKTISHGIVLLRVANQGKEVAKEVELIVRSQPFAKAGEWADNIWELDVKDWREDIVHLADLNPGQAIIVPLAHLVGTHIYYGQVVIPQLLKWRNPVTGRIETAGVGRMMPEDQWMTKGLNIRVAQ